MCSVISASRTCCTTRSTISRRKGGIVQQGLLRQPCVHPTMIFGHRHYSVSDRLLLTPTILEDDGLSF
jgi:hypothetical protein